ncbi:MAG: BatD family protein [Bacteroidota bacterium]
MMKVMKVVKRLLLPLCFIPFSLSAQNVSFEVHVTADTLFYGNVLKVKFELVNAPGDFQPPSFDQFEIVGGPNTSTQFSMINGEVTQSASYEYLLLPLEEGNLTIASATVSNGVEPLQTEPLSIVVLPNPDGIQQRYANYINKPNPGIILPPGEMSHEDSLRMKYERLRRKSKKI